MPLSRRNMMLLAAGGSLALLVGAFVFQALGYAPCKLCLWQRWPHAAAIALGGLVLLLGPLVLVGIAGALAAATTAGIGIYHTGVERGFCAECGTPVYYKNEKWPEETHLMSLTLDDPNRVPPREHYHWAERVVWEDSAASLPKHDASAETTK